jgi:hypothetical protein
LSIRKALVLLAPVAALLSGPTPTAASCATPYGLTGTWEANDGGTYRVRAIGHEVWWIGTSADGGKSWTNLFYGSHRPGALSGRWISMSGPGSGGTLELSLKGSKQMVLTESTGSPFGATEWNLVDCVDDGDWGDAEVTPD